MTTLAEFKEIESLADLLEAISEGEKWGTLTRDEVKTVLKAARSFPALIAVADGMAEALANINSSACDAGDSEGKTGAAWVAASCREISDKALAAYEAWKNEIEGEK